jgi:hypothetical protein
MLLAVLVERPLVEPRTPPETVGSPVEPAARPQTDMALVGLAAFTEPAVVVVVALVEGRGFPFQAAS